MSSTSTTPVHLPPPPFPYPIKITSVDAAVNSDVQRGTRLLSYSFLHIPKAPGSTPEPRYGTWDSSLEGTLVRWNVQPGDKISEERARKRPVVIISEPCKHGMQHAGMCVLCGKDMTNTDYTGFSDASRASIQMTHSADGPTVSLEEAQRIERETAENLLKVRKLSLIVDLDQTIVHATVDPTVGEWMAEGEAWEARDAERNANHLEGLDDDDECNPNWEALKDVKRFRLGPESFAPVGHRSKGKVKTIESDGCMYYIKPRPGWKRFLEDAATKYEMHVYTMGTRAYAEEVCAAIDPDKKIFGGRLLSRDESGSLTQKSLQRLFPCDTSMVVIIDDRADVWEWSPNLIKVIPYDFFVGIGDINSSFLPKIQPLGPQATQENPQPAPETLPGIVPIPTPEEAEKAASETTAAISENSLILEAQVEERPLAKKQEELEDSPDASSTQVEQASSNDDIVSTSSKSDRQAHKKALLKNDDIELQRVSRLLDDVHDKFFEAYDARSTYAQDPSSSSNHRRSSISQRRPRPPKPDVTRIIPDIRSSVLAGVHILFSSVIPLDTQPETTEIWRMAHMFGAACSTELNDNITHVVAAKRGTVKVDSARKRGGSIKIVWLAWFTDSIAFWARQDEAPYFLDDPTQLTHHNVLPEAAGPPQISLDPDGVEDGEWDDVAAGPKGAAPGRLDFDEIDWNNINDEVDAAMNESDEEEDSEGSGGGLRSDDDMSEISHASGSSPSLLKRKRLKSVTPSPKSASSSVNGDTEGTRTPDAKRTKLSKAPSRDGSTKRSSPAASPKAEQEEESSEEGSEEEDLQDDFLARELEEEWG